MTFSNSTYRCGKLFKGGNYSRVETIRGNKVSNRHLINFGAELIYPLVFCLHSVWKLPNLSHPNKCPTSMGHTVIPRKMSRTSIEYVGIKVPIKERF